MQTPGLKRLQTEDDQPSDEEQAHEERQDIQLTLIQMMIVEELAHRVPFAAKRMATLAEPARELPQDQEMVHSDCSSPEEMVGQINHERIFEQLGKKRKEQTQYQGK